MCFEYVGQSKGVFYVKTPFKGTENVGHKVVKFSSEKEARDYVESMKSCLIFRPKKDKRNLR